MEFTILESHEDEIELLKLQTWNRCFQ